MPPKEKAEHTQFRRAACLKKDCLRPPTSRGEIVHPELQSNIVEFPQGNEFVLWDTPWGESNQAALPPGRIAEHKQPLLVWLVAATLARVYNSPGEKPKLVRIFLGTNHMFGISPQRKSK